MDDVLAIIRQAIENDRKRPQPPLHPECLCGRHRMDARVFEWLQDRNRWMHVRAWVLAGRLDAFLPYIKDNHPDFWKWYQEF